MGFFDNKRVPLVEFLATELILVVGDSRLREFQEAGFALLGQHRVI